MDQRAFDDLLELYRWRFGIEDPSLLDWTGTMRVRTRITDAPVRDARPDAPARNTVVYGPAGDQLTHPDHSLRLVVLDERTAAARLAEARRVARDAVVVWAPEGTVSVRWLRTPGTGRPAVTVLVHTDGDAARLEASLRAIAATTPSCAAIELLVADGGPGDAAAAVAAAWSRQRALRYVRADPARGPVAAVNAGAEAARGELLVLVADHVRVRPGWLRPLVRLLRERPEAGVVGGRLLAADGAVHEAGGVLCADGGVTGFGRGSRDEHDPRLRHVRVVPWVSGDLLATRTGLLRRMGGLDPLLGEAHADVDYCLRVQGAGRRVLYQPQSIVVTGRERPAGDAAGEAQRRFARRWTAALAALPARPGPPAPAAGERRVPGA